jgi:PAS domain S-box-containing protein
VAEKKPYKKKIDVSALKLPLNAQEEIDAVLIRFLDQFYWFFFGFGGLALIITVFQALNSGWHYIITIDIAAYFLLVSLFPFRKKLNIRIVICIIILLLLVFAFYDFIVFGLLSVGILILAGLLFLIGAFFGIRAGFIGLSIVTSGLLLIAIGFCTGYLPVFIDAQVYLTAPGSWIVHINLFIILVVCVLLCYGLILRKLKSSLSDLSKKSGKLSLANKKLQQQAKARKESENKYRMLVNNMSDILFVQDMNLNITHLSPSVKQLFGYSVEEGLRLKMGDLMTKDSVQKAIQLFKKNAGMAKKKEIDIPLMQYEYIRKDGSTFWGELKVIFLRDKKNKLTGIQGILRDISERRKTEEERKALHEQLLHSQKMEAVGQLAGGIAHDFNNQLLSIMGYAEILKDEYVQDSQVLEYSTKIISSVRRAADLTKKLLAFARKGKYQTLPIDIHALINEVIIILKHSIDKTILIEKQLEASSPIVEGDPGQIQNALLNIALNARDAMPTGGGLKFRTASTNLTESTIPAFHSDIKPGPFIKICISDTGTGFTEEARKHIFEPFYTTKEAGKGTGMGLASVYGTVQTHRGGIDVQSEPGKGTSFCIYLPLSKEATGLASEIQPDKIFTRGKGRIMVIEDENDIRSMLETMLSRLGYTCFLFSNGALALEQYEKQAHDIDLVILDFILPAISGKTVFETMRTKNPQVKILISSGYSADGEIQQLLTKDHTGFIQKPFSLADLAKKITELLAQ